MRTLLLLMGLLGEPECRVYYAHPDRSWEHLGAWSRLEDVPREWRGQRPFVIIREQRLQ